MEECDMLPLKRVEMSLTKFNDVAIPHHLDLLRQHKANILKCAEGGAAEVRRVRAEQAAAARVTARLRALLHELDALRRRVRPADRARFDALTQRSRDATLRAIVDYLGAARADADAPAPSVACSVGSTESVGVLERAPPGEPLLQLCVDEQVPPLCALILPARDQPFQEWSDRYPMIIVAVSVQEREELLRGWSALQAEVRALHEVWQHAQAAALAQSHQVARAADSVQIAAEHAGAARTHLAAAERYGGGAVSVGGALVGALVGGPLGLALGAKAGAAAALAGSVLGYCGARLLRRRAAPRAKDL